MLSLTRLFLHHWHRFYATTIDVDSGLCLTGPEAANAAAIFDALQLVLVGDPAQVQFTGSLEGLAADLDSYTRGRLSADKWQRPGNTVSYIIIEFTHTFTNAKSTLGLCIETGPHLTPEITWFSLADQLTPATFVTKGRPLPRLELKPLLRNWRGARFFEKAVDYQAEVLNILGGLDDRFLELLQRALRYQPVRRADEFACAWFFDAHPLDLTRLRRLRERLGQLHAEHDRAEKQLAALQPILKGQIELARLTQLRDGQTLLAAMLRSTATGRKVAALESQIAGLQAQLTAARTDFLAAQKTCADLEIQLREAERIEFENGLAHRKTILQWQNRYATFAADVIRLRWNNLQRQIQTESNHLRKITGLASEEQTALNELLSVIDAATAPDTEPGGEPPPTLAAGLEAGLPVLLAARDRLSAERTRLVDQRSALQSALERCQLSSDQPVIAEYVERMQALLEPVIGKKPPLLYEFIEITDLRWQNAVEAMLGPCRFHAIVSATWFNAARAAINKARQSHNLQDADVHDPTQLYNRPAQAGSLAQKVTTIYPDLKVYLDTLLGGIMAVESEGELRQYPRAITSDCVIYSDWHTRPIPITEYQPLVIGKHASRVYNETRQKYLDSVQAQISNIQAQLSTLETTLAQLNHAQTLAVLRDGLNAPLDERPARAEAATYEAELRGLDLAPVNELHSQADQLRSTIAQQAKTKDEISYKIAALELELRLRQNELTTARVAWDESKTQAATTRNQFSALAVAADEALPPHLKPDDLSAEIKSVEQKDKDFDKKVRDERQRLVEAISAFNVVYQPGAWLGDPNDARYAEALRRLADSDVPRLQQQITSAEQDIEEELRDHLMRPLREHLGQVQQTLDQINDTLAELESPYRLHVEPAVETKEFYPFILDPAQTQPQTLGLFYEALTTQPELAARLIDYRRYLNYSIQTQNAEGQTVHLPSAEGEAQLAFYTAIAASFAQVYRIRGDRSGRPCLRLVPLGVAFASMDTALITPVIELFKQFGLQLAAAIPLERSDYLIAHLPTTIVLTPVGGTVLAEPYRNYAALPAPEPLETPST